MIDVVADIEVLAAHAAEHIVAAAAHAVERSGTFSFVLSGGSTPKRLYELLASDACRGRIDWSHVEIFFGDERTVPPDSPESNFHTANVTFLSKMPIPPRNIHRMRGEIDPNEAAVEYGRLLQARFGETGGPDLTLLGMGDDGHTASLFPGTEALKQTHHRCVANYVPKFATWRMTMTAPFLNRSGLVLILVSGLRKAPVLQQVLHGPPNPQTFPVQMIAPAGGRLIWIVDRPAAGA